MSGIVRRIVAFFAFSALLLMGGTGLASTAASAASAAPAAQQAAAAPAANPGDIGWEGPSFGSATGSPSESKPESKLWYNDGKWWAVLIDPTSSDYFVYRLDISNHTWVKTATALDTRPDTRSDALWDGAHLYVASHRFTSNGTAATGPSWQSLLYRYSYDAGSDTYSLNSGFPAVINDVRSETLVIDEDSTGSLWATWKQDTSIRMARSNPGGTGWGASFVLPGSDTVSADDISSVLAFGSNKIGVMWSNQVDQKMYFSVHADGAATTSWAAPEVAYSGPSAADDHMNLKGLSDQNGRILAGVKTSLGGSTQTLIHLLDRSASGAWTSHVFGTGANNHTRPIVVIDSDHSVVHMFATAGQSGGSVYEKTAPLSNIHFSAGVGTPVLTDADSADMNNATSTKQNVTGATGLVVLATNDATSMYWTHYDDLGGPNNGVPHANAGTDQSVNTNSTVTLDASGSSTGGSSTVAYRWQQVSGSTVRLSDPTAIKPQFTAPGDPDSMVFRVTVTTPQGSSTDEVTINAVAPK